MKNTTEEESKNIHETLWNKVFHLPLKTPFVNDYLRLYPKTFDFKGRLPRSSFWKSIIGFLVCYFIFAIACNLTYLWFIPRIPIWIPWTKNYVEWLVITQKVLSVLPLVFIGISAFPIFGGIARRLRDARFSPWWLLLMALSYLGFAILLVMLTFPARETKITLHQGESIKKRKTFLFIKRDNTKQ